MKVRELIEALQKLVAEHPEAAELEALSQGCDCVDSCEDVVLDGDSVLLARGRGLGGGSPDLPPQPPPALCGCPCPDDATMLCHGLAGHTGLHAAGEPECGMYRRWP